MHLLGTEYLRILYLRHNQPYTLDNNNDCVHILLISTNYPDNRLPSAYSDHGITYGTKGGR